MDAISGWAVLTVLRVMHRCEHCIAVKYAVTDVVQREDGGFIGCSKRDSTICSRFSLGSVCYREVRTAVDLCHRDGSLKREVAADPGKYIHEVRQSRETGCPFKKADVKKLDPTGSAP